MKIIRRRCRRAIRPRRGPRRRRRRRSYPCTTCPASSSHRHQPHRCRRHQHPARRRSRLHRHNVAIFIDFAPGVDTEYIDTPPFDYINMTLQSSSGEDVVYIGATGRLHDAAIFIDLSSGKDADCTGTLPFSYTDRLHRAKVVPATVTPRGLHRRARIVVIFKRRRHAATLKSTPTSTSTHFPDIVQAPTRRSHFTDMSFPDEAIHILPGTDKAKASQHVRRRRGGHHQARHRHGEGHPSV